VFVVLNVTDNIVLVMRRIIKEPFLPVYSLVRCGGYIVEFHMSKKDFFIVHDLGNNGIVSQNEYDGKWQANIKNLVSNGLVKLCNANDSGKRIFYQFPNQCVYQYQSLCLFSTII
jgi:hypothetical protein